MPPTITGTPPAAPDTADAASTAPVVTSGHTIWPITPVPYVDRLDRAVHALTDGTHLPVPDVVRGPLASLLTLHANAARAGRLDTSAVAVADAINVAAARAHLGATR